MVVTAPPSPIKHVSFIKADVSGAPTDAEILTAGFTALDGMQCVNTVDSKLYVRMVGVWKGTVALT